MLSERTEACITLRIVTWNCNMALRLKLDRLRALRPDVAVIQECADPNGANGWHFDGAACDWIGFNPDKGLGIFTFGDWELARHASYSDKYALCLPVTVRGPHSFNLLGVWAAAPRTTPAGATNDPLLALRYYQPFLAAGPAIVAGDFNRLPQQMSARRGGVSGAIVDVLAAAGLTNADTARSAALGQVALQRTHFHQRKFSRGFVVDYLFLPTSWVARLSVFEVGDPHDWITWSDHVPLVAEINL